MNSGLQHQLGRNWLLWTATVLAAAGGLAPLLVGGLSSRANAVLIPFFIAAMALAACASLGTLGRIGLQVVYFVAGLAIIYGLLSVFSIGLRSAVLGACPAPPASCTTGLAQPLTDGEVTGIASAAAFGIVAVILGFFGLVRLVRRPARESFVPPVRKIPPIQTATTTPTAPPATETKSELPAPEDEPELPAPEELPELPSHESSPVNT